MNDICLKAILIGDASVGKTALLLKYIDGKFLENHIATIGVEYKEKIIKHNNIDIKLQIWDTAGQEIYRSLTRNFYRNADVFLFVFDITNEESYIHIKDWLKESEEDLGKNFKKILIGNKFDLNHKRKVDKERMTRFAQNNNMKCFETSAKEGNNVDIIFTEAVKLLLGNKSNKEIMDEFAYRNADTSIVSLDSHKSTSKRKKCC